MAEASKTALELKRAYEREWRARNKEKVKQYNQNYWQKKAEQLAKENEANG